MYHTNSLPTFTYAGALMPQRKPIKWQPYAWALAAAVLVLANVM